MNLRDKRIWIVVLVGVFGTFYAAISDIALSLGPLVAIENDTVVRLMAGGFVLGLTLAYLVVAQTLPRVYARRFGFVNVLPQWLPTESESRAKVTRSVILEEFAKERGQRLLFASITGEWDIVRPLSDTELHDLFKDRQAELRVLVAHPESEGLRVLCRREGKDLLPMKRKICRNTRTLLEHGGESVEVRWHFGNPAFHIIANDTHMHVGYYPRTGRGHDSRRYCVSSDSEIYSSMMDWFEDQWQQAVDARRELAWVEKSAVRDRAVFLDRDDTLIRDVGYSSLSHAEIEILPNVVEALRRLHAAGFRLIVVSNQQAVGLDMVDQEELVDFTKRFRAEFKKHGVFFDAIYHCTHRENEDCNCRKPRPLLFERAVRTFSLDLARCHMVGDSESDVEVQRFLPELRTHRLDRTHDLLDIAANEILEA